MCDVVVHKLCPLHHRGRKLWIREVKINHDIVADRSYVRQRRAISALSAGLRDTCRKKVK